MAPPPIVATPVVTARQWATALAPRNSSGWKFVTQSYNVPDDVPTQWVLIDIEDGVVTLQDALNQIYSNTNFQVASANTLITTTNQLRAANGRIFFPEAATPGIGNDDEVNIAYYDPSDEQIHQLPAVVDPGGERQSIIYQMVFGNSGATMWGGTQSAIGSVPMIFDLDPATLATSFVCNVGTVSANPKYAYTLAKDEGPGADFLYVGVGQDTWELISIDLTTNTPTTLLTTSGPGFQFIEFEDRAGLGWSVNVYDNGVQTRYWIADGAITAYPGGGAPPGGARNVTPYTNPLVAPPQIDHSRGIEHFLWRPNGSTGAWTEITYEVDYKSPITLESLAVLPNDTVIGNAQQYSGFFTYDGVSSTWFGNWPLGVSQPALCVLDDDEVYIAGYPNGSLFRWDPQSAWAPDGTSAGNPSAIGTYGTDVRYPYFLIRCSANNRLYACGRKERDSLGSGIRIYDIDTNTFGATSGTELDDFIPRGFLVQEAISRIVYSGEVLTVSPEALLIVYDYDLNVVDSWIVQAGLQNTGLLFPTSDPNIVVGLTNDAPCLLYRFNITTGALLASVNLGAVVIGGTAMRDGFIYAEMSQDLFRIDPETLVTSLVVDLEVSSTYLAWDSSNDLLIEEGANIRELEGAGEIAATLVFASPNQLIYRLESNGAGVLTLTETDLRANSVGGSINRIARASTTGYAGFGPGALTQNQARTLWLSQDAIRSVATARAFVVGRTGNSRFVVDADVDADGAPQLQVTSLATGTGYLFIRALGAAGT